MSAAVVAARPMRQARELAADYLTGFDALLLGQKKHMDSGFTTVDRQIPGWLHEGHLIIVAGRPAMGKSAFAQQVCEAVATQDKATILFSLEMSCKEITERSVARRARVSIPKLKTGEGVTPADRVAVNTALESYSGLPFFVDDTTFDIAEMVTKTKAEAAGFLKKGLPRLGCVVVDYLQLAQAKGANRNLEIGQITGALKRLAKELSVPVLALSQLNRAVEGRTDRRPTLSDLRDSGNIEQDADLVLYVYRDDYYDPVSADKGLAEIGTLKNRHGATGIAKLAFKGEHVTFSDRLAGADFEPERDTKFGKRGWK